MALVSRPLRSSRSAASAPTISLLRVLREYPLRLRFVELYPQPSVADDCAPCRACGLQVVELERRGHTVILAAVASSQFASREIAPREGASVDRISPAEPASVTASPAAAQKAAPEFPRTAAKLFLAGAVAVADSLKPDAFAVVKQLTRQGIQV